MYSLHFRYENVGKSDVILSMICDANNELWSILRKDFLNLC